MSSKLTIKSTDYSECGVNIDNVATITFNNNNSNNNSNSNTHNNLCFPEFKNLNIKLNNINKYQFIELLRNREYTKFKIVKRNTILTNEFSQLVVETINYKKYFSEFLPSIPLIQIIPNDMSPSNSCIFLNDEPYGIQLDEQYVLPFSILFPLLINLCTYNGIFICNQLSYDMIEVNEIYKKENINYYAIINEKIKFKTHNKMFQFNKNDIIYSINNNKFNNNGKIYSETLEINIPLNLYFMLCESNYVTIEYTNNPELIYDNSTVSINKFKYISVIIPIIEQQNLKIPIISNDIFKYGKLEFSILSEQIMINNKDCPITESQFYKNHISTNKYVVLTNHDDGLLYILKKISNKKIHSLESLKEYIKSLNDKNKITLHFERFNEELKITII
jgi:hypothetical protein